MAEPDHVVPTEVVDSASPATGIPTTESDHLRIIVKHTAIFTKHWTTMLSSIARPIDIPDVLTAAQIRISFPEVEAEFAQLTQVHEVCGPLLAGIRQLMRDIRHEKNGLYSIQIQRSKKLWSTDFDRRMVEVNTLLFPLYHLIRMTRSLELIWQKRPPFLRPSSRHLHEVASVYYGDEDQLRSQLDAARQYRFESCTFAGCNLGAMSLVAAKFEQCSILHLRIRVAPNQAARQEYTRRWKLYGEVLRSCPMPDLFGEDGGRSLQRLRQIQQEGMKLLDRDFLPGEVFSMDGVRMENCQINHVDITASQKIEGLNIHVTEIDQFRLQGEFQALRLQDIASCRGLQLNQAVLKSPCFRDVSGENWIIRESILSEVDIHMLHIRGGQIRNLRILSGRMTHVIFEDMHLSGEIHIEAAACRLVFRNPLIAEGTVLSGLAKSWIIEYPGDELRRLAIPQLRIEDLTIRGPERVVFADGRNLQADLDAGRLHVDGHTEATRSPFEDSVPVKDEVVVSCRVQGITVYRLATDTAPGLLTRAHTKYEDARIRSDQWAPTLRALGQDVDESTLATTLADLDLVPLTATHLRQLRDLSTTVSEQRLRKTRAEIPLLLRAGHCAGSVLERQMSMFRDEGYREDALATLPGLIASYVAEVLDENAQSLDTQRGFEEYCAVFEGDELTFLEAAEKYLRDEYPHLYPVRPEYLKRVYRNLHPVADTGPELDPLEQEVAEMDRILQLAASRILAIQTSDLPPDVAQDQIDFWECWRDQALRQFEED